LCGLAGKGNTRLDTALLYRVANNCIEEIYIAPEREGLATKKGASEQDALRSKVFAMVAPILDEALGPEKEYAWNDYLDIPVIG
jgi:hypothetical protein